MGFLSRLLMSEKEYFFLDGSSWEINISRDNMKCPKCSKEVYFAEKVTSLGKDWHKLCLKCTKCSRILTPGSHAENSGKPYCHNPCYSALFGPGGFGRGGTESHKY